MRNDADLSSYYPSDSKTHLYFFVIYWLVIDAVQGRKKISTALITHAAG